MICQTRRKRRECPSPFSQSYNRQEPNKLYKAPLNAPKNSSILGCKDEELDDSPHLGYAPMVHNGKPVYCIFLVKELLDRMKEYEWLDDLTDSVDVYTLIYTPDVDTLTLVQVNFEFSPTGRITSRDRQFSYTSIQASDRWVSWLVLTIIFLILSAARMLQVTKWWWTMPSLVTRFDLFQTLAFIAFSTYSLSRRSLGVDAVLSNIMPLINCFLGVDDTSSANAINFTINTYFDTLNMVMGQVTLEEAMKLIAYFLILMSLVRLIGYMAVHPKISIIAKTITNGLDDVFHFMLVFVSIFVTMAWLAHWSFGMDKEPFSSMPTALNTCFQMLIGEYPWGPEHTEGLVQKVWLVVYTFLIYFVTINVLLAIIVEAYLGVKKDNEDDVSTRNVCVDIPLLTAAKVMRWHYQWPSHASLHAHFFAMRFSAQPVTEAELITTSFARFQSKESIYAFFNYYYQILGDDVLTDVAREHIREEELKKCSMQYFMDGYNLTFDEMVRMAALTAKVQCAWRRYVAVKKVHRLRRRKTIVQSGVNMDQAMQMSLTEVMQKRMEVANEQLSKADERIQLQSQEIALLKQELQAVRSQTL